MLVLDQQKLISISNLDRILNVPVNVAELVRIFLFWIFSIIWLENRPVFVLRFERRAS